MTAMTDLRVIEEVLLELGIQIRCIIDMGLQTLIPKAQDVCADYLESLLLGLREMLVKVKEMVKCVLNKI